MPEGPCWRVYRYRSAMRARNPAFSAMPRSISEANYDDEMLMNGSYPFHLKNRIRSDLGHLSNDQALELFTLYRPPFMSHLFLSHLSRDNNSPRIVKNVFNRIAGGTQIIIASRDKETALYHIRDSMRTLAATGKIPRAIRQKLQLSLF